MLSTFQVATALALTLGDVLVLQQYTSSPSTNGKKSHYPKLTLMAHVIGGLFALALGTLSLTLYQAGIPSLASIAAVGQGLCVLGPLGAFSMHMALYTHGHPGFNLSGYIMYALANVYSGVMGMLDPSPQTSYACFVMAHAYLTCRIFVILFERVLQWRGDGSYSTATNIASNITLVLAYGTNGMRCHALITVLALWLECAGVGRFHAIRGKHNKISTPHFPPLGPSLCAVSLFAFVACSSIDTTR